MKFKYLLLAATCVSPISAYAKDAASASEAKSEAEAPQAAAKQVFSTGVAKGRDILDAAISTSSLQGEETEKLSARSLSEILRNIPGIRAEAVSGEGNASYSIRGLPLAANGSKFLQLQEDGLPVLEFGDLSNLGTDMFMRADLNLSQIEAIRGGSASTFASNSPGGVINLMSKNGDVEGGTIMATTGLDYSESRVDFDYGAKVSDTLRFHIGGFYRQGEGPRHAGYDAQKGGQVKFNVTKTFSSGYVRLYLKYLDDQTPGYMSVPVKVTGTNANPKYENIVGFDVRKDAFLSNGISSTTVLDKNNNVSRDDVHEGMHPIVKSIGLESQFDVGEWTINEKFRFADISGRSITNQPLVVGPAGALTAGFGGAGATLSYANGGAVISNPAALNGNGLLSRNLLAEYRMNSLDNMTNDLRATRVWELGEGKLTTTAGFYKSSQDFNVDWALNTVLTDVVGDGNTSLLNIRNAAGQLVSQDGTLAFGSGGPNGSYHRHYDVKYDVNAPYGSINFHQGKVAIGGSVRYDYGSVRGTLFGSDLGGGRIGVVARDLDGDGVISIPERNVSTLPLSSPGKVDYDYHYLSYSAGVNFRVSEPLAVFGRYSRGGRAAADRILFTPSVDYTTGKLLDSKDGYDTVKQAEVGVKYRTANLSLNLTGFLANTGERNLQVNASADGTSQLVRIVRSYKAHGAEFEGSYRNGGFVLNAGATFTKAEISGDATNPALVGNRPRHASDLIYTITPQYETKLFTVGVNAVGTTSSYTQDSNQLKLPGYTLFNTFVQFRPMDRVQLMLNANNLFNKIAFVEITNASIPASGLALGRAVNGRTISGSLAFSF